MGKGCVIMVEDVMVLKTPYIELKTRAIEYQTVISKHTTTVRTSILTELDNAKRVRLITGIQYTDISNWLGE